MDDIEELSDLFLKIAANKDPNLHRDYMREYMANRYKSVRQKVISDLGGKCSRCGSIDDLHLDHINKKKKTMRMTDIHSVSDSRLKQELKNIQVLCKDCHNAKTHEAWDFNAPKPTHGTYSMYQRQKCRCKKCVQAYRDLMESRRVKALSVDKLAGSFLKLAS